MITIVIYRKHFVDLKRTYYNILNHINDLIVLPNPKDMKIAVGGSTLIDFWCGTAGSMMKQLTPNIYNTDDEEVSKILSGKYRREINDINDLIREIRKLNNKER